MSTRTSRAIKFLAAFFVIASLVVATLVAFRHNHSERSSRSTAEGTGFPAVPLESYVFHGAGGRGETRVPFTLYGGTIEINAVINGKPMRCSVDTGSQVISWNAGLHLTNQRTGLQTMISDAGGNIVPIQEAMLNSVQIGDLELKNIRSYAITSGDPQSDPIPNLGNPVFAHTLLTIDYIRQELIIRCPPPADILSRIRCPQNVLSFRWIDPDPRGRFGIPCFHAQVMSQSADVILDTGWVDQPLGVSSRFYQQLLPELKVKHIQRRKGSARFFWGSADVLTMNRLSSSFAGLTWIGSADVAPALSPSAQAVLCYGFLRHCRTTIDYPQQKIWFD